MHCPLVLPRQLTNLLEFNLKGSIQGDMGVYLLEFNLKGSIQGDLGVYLLEFNLEGSIQGEYFFVGPDIYILKTLRVFF